MNDEMVTELLVQMEGAKKSGKPVFVLAATNHLEHIDGAVLYRLSEKIEVPYPTEEQRARLLTVFLSKYRQVDFDVPAVAAELASRIGDVGGRESVSSSSAPRRTRRSARKKRARPTGS